MTSNDFAADRERLAVLARGAQCLADRITDLAAGDALTDDERVWLADVGEVLADVIERRPRRPAAAAPDGPATPAVSPDHRSGLLAGVWRRGWLN